MSGERVDAVRGVADQRETRCDDLRHLHQAQGEGRRRRERLEVAEHAAAGRGDPRAQFFRRQGEQFCGVRVGRRPDDRNPVDAVGIGERQPGENAVGAEPLAGDATVRAGAGEVGDDAHFAVRRVAGDEPGLAAHPGIAAVGADQKAGAHPAAVGERQLGSFVTESKGLRGAWREQGEAVLTAHAFP